MTKIPLIEQAFPSAEAFTTWLEKNHAICPGIWLCFAKKGSGIPSVTAPEAVEIAICFGWIDGQIKPRDRETYLVRYGPRGPHSIWSKINRGKAGRLIEEGRMGPAGLREVERAKAAGRWEAAYDSARTITVPEDLAAVLESEPEVKEFFDGISAANRYAILFRLQTAKKPETRARRLEQCVTMLREKRTFHAPAKKKPPTRPI